MDPSEILFNDIEIPLKVMLIFTFEGESFDIDYIIGFYLKEYKQFILKKMKTHLAMYLRK